MSYFKSALIVGASLTACLGFLNSCGSPNDNSTLAETEISPPGGRQGPGQTEVKGEQNFATLINSYARGKPKHAPWAGWWWAFTSNGIANGSHDGSHQSPAGKYDSARGRRTQAEQWEVVNHGSKKKVKPLSWEGHCNGWSAAAALLDEPREAKKVNGITFSVADQKALVAEAAMLANSDFFGNRVQPGDPQWKYDDIVADQYFLVMTNYMGKAQMVVNMDRFTGVEVWNQPIAGYSFSYPKPSDVLPPSAEAPNIHRVKVTTTVWWAEDGVAPDVLTPEFKYQTEVMNTFSYRTLDMEIWLDGPVVFDADGKITSSGDVVVARGTHDGETIGGKWFDGGDTANGHPDFLWVPTSILNATNPEVNKPGNDDANPYVDIDWVRDHVLKGVSDGTVAAPVPSAPPVEPSSSPSPGPSTRPGPVPSTNPRPVPNPAPSRHPND